VGVQKNKEGGAVKRILISFAMFLAASLSAQAGTVIMVGDVIKGAEYSAMLNRWLDRDFRMWVGVDDGIEMLMFTVDGGVGRPTFRMHRHRDDINKLETSILKSLEWAKVAQKNKIDVNNQINCFGLDQYDLCQKNGAYSEGQMSLSFVSGSSGKDVNLKIILFDESNKFLNANIHFKLAEMRKLLANVRAIDATFVKAKKQETNSKTLFK
jgi:hypothetical protein